MSNYSSIFASHIYQFHHIFKAGPTLFEFSGFQSKTVDVYIQSYERYHKDNDDIDHYKNKAYLLFILERSYHDLHFTKAT